MKKSSLAILLLLAMGKTHACSCVLLSPVQAKALNDHAFIGRVTDVQPSGSLGKLSVSFKVSDNIKGTEERSLVVLVPEGPLLCGYDRPFFVPGTTYLVFANKVEENIETSACSPNQAGRPSKKDIRELRRGT